MSSVTNSSMIVMRPQASRWPIAAAGVRPKSTPRTSGNSGVEGHLVLRDVQTVAEVGMHRLAIDDERVLVAEHVRDPVVGLAALRRAFVVALGQVARFSASGLGIQTLFPLVSSSPVSITPPGCRKNFQSGESSSCAAL